METSNDLISSEILKPVRSSFLTVLCILSFLGSGYGILRAITVLTSSDKVVKMTGSQMNSQREAENRKRLQERKDKGAKFELKMVDSMKQYTDKKKLQQKSASELVLNILTLAGAILMWRMKRKGYLFYVAGTIIWIVAPLIIFGTGTFIAVLESAFGFFIGLLFCILYAMNLKDMKEERVAV